MDYKTCFQGKKILVVEDDPVNRELMQDILSQMSCQIEFAVNGVEAVDKALKGGFDLVFMDVRLPDKDGMQATREIRAKEQGKHIIILALTASVVDDRNQILDSGVDDMVSKPVNLQELREKMAKHLLGNSQ